MAKTTCVLSECVSHCQTCRLGIDRDPNATKNLTADAASVAPEWPGDVKPGLGADRKTRPVGPVAKKRQPGTAHADKTGTAPPEGGATSRELTHAP